MQWLSQFFDFILHAEGHLKELGAQFGMWIYALMFLIIFAETGLVVTPLLPGDSLLFALGAFAAQPDGLSLPLLMALLTAAAILGDSVNYAIGHRLAKRVLSGKPIPLINPKHLEKTHEFYERYGAKTIILARFVPIVRTFAPFVAGMGRMQYRRFMIFNVIGGVVWIQGFLLAGYFFSNLPGVQGNLPMVMMAIVFVSILPAIIEFWRERRRAKLEATAKADPPPPDPAASNGSPQRRPHTQPQSQPQNQ